MLRDDPVFCNRFLKPAKNNSIQSSLFSCVRLLSPLQFPGFIDNGKSGIFPEDNFHAKDLMTLTAGILSDTHLMQVDSSFRKKAASCFADCDVIIHAGDLTTIELLDIFYGKEVFAVHGNMCDMSTSRRLPKQLTFALGGFTIGLTHGAGLGHDIETALWDIFPEADCMIYGHTHRAVCHRQGSVLIINPGSFRSTGPYGASGTYALLEIGSSLQASILPVPQSP